MICATDIAAVFLADVFDDVRAAVVGKVDVDIGRVDAFGIQKAFEEQAVTDRIDVRNFQQIGDDANRRRNRAPRRKRPCSRP